MFDGCSDGGLGLAPLDVGCSRVDMETDGWVQRFNQLFIFLFEIKILMAYTDTKTSVFWSPL